MTYLAGQNHLNFIEKLKFSYVPPFRLAFQLKYGVAENVKDISEGLYQVK